MHIYIYLYIYMYTYRAKHEQVSIRSVWGIYEKKTVWQEYKLNFTSNKVIK